MFALRIKNREAQVNGSSRAGRFPDPGSQVLVAEESGMLPAIPAAARIELRFAKLLCRFLEFLAVISARKPTPTGGQTAPRSSRRNRRRGWERDERQEGKGYGKEG